MKAALRGALPYAVVRRVQDRRAAAERQERTVSRAARLRDAEERWEAGSGAAWDYELAIEVLAGRGLDEIEVRDGSVPEDALAFSGDVCRRELPADRPLLGLHVGNFVGVSLAAQTAMLRGVHPGSVMVAVDPDLPHRGIDHPAAHAIALLRHFGLSDAVLPVTAFSLAANIGNDGIDAWGGADELTEQLHASAAAEGALDALVPLAAGRFDFAMLDGNHDGTYLERELTRVAALLRPGGILVLDDVDAQEWAAIAEVVAALFADADGAFRRIATHGRVAVAARR